jgi:succinyl-CoA synthetase beta subunit
MKLLEYQGKQLFQVYGIPIPEGKIKSNKKTSLDLDFPCVIKAQVPVGGRGKAGGIKFAENKEEARIIISSLLNANLKGFIIKKILIEEKIDIKNELYLSVSLDSSKRMPLFMASRYGGVDIESVRDELIHKEWINPLIGIQPFNIRRILSSLKLENGKKEISDILRKMYRLFREYDCELVEINPLVFTRNGEVKALDAKIIINDDALYRHEDIIVEETELTPLEKEAKEKGIAFIQLDGNIGVIANGAGLTMATLDAINHYGGKPGIFLDLGGTDDPEKVKQAFELMKRAKPKVILLNLFGGITKCDTVAKGVKAVITKEGIDCPVVTRIKGVNEDIAKKILKDAGFITTESLQDAAKKTCDAGR